VVDAQVEDAQENAVDYAKQQHHRYFSHFIIDLEGTIHHHIIVKKVGDISAVGDMSGHVATMGEMQIHHGQATHLKRLIV